MDLVLLMILCYSLYRMAIGYNIAPWRWVLRFVMVFMLSVMAIVSALAYHYGDTLLKDPDLFKKLAPYVPITLLYEVVLFFVFRGRMVKYVHGLDEVDALRDNPPSSPPSAPSNKPKDEGKDFSYFR